MLAPTALAVPTDDTVVAVDHEVDLRRNGQLAVRPGQLEHECQSNGWLHCTADSELIFSPNLEQKYDLALSKIGVDPSHLVSDAGHA